MLDLCSISHLIAGIISYYIGFFLFALILKIDSLSSILLSYMCTLVGGIIWEFFENIFIIEMKVNKRQDSPINSLTDILLVFLGAIVGCCTFELHKIHWILYIVLIGGLLILYSIARMFTERNNGREK